MIIALMVVSPTTFKDERGGAEPKRWRSEHTALVQILAKVSSSSSNNMIWMSFSSYNKPVTVKKTIAPRVWHFVFADVIISVDTIRDTMVYYWSLPRQFLGNKLGAYGGNLTFYQVPP